MLFSFTGGGQLGSGGELWGSDLQTSASDRACGQPVSYRRS